MSLAISILSMYKEVFSESVGDYALQLAKEKVKNINKGVEQVNNIRGKRLARKIKGDYERPWLEPYALDDIDPAKITVGDLQTLTDMEDPRHPAHDWRKADVERQVRPRGESYIGQLLESVTKKNLDSKYDQVCRVFDRITKRAGLCDIKKQ